MNFRQFIENVNLDFGYVNPDSLWNNVSVREYRVEGGFTFIYTEKEGLLITDRMDRHGDLREKFFGDRIYQHHGIEGRCGEMTVDGRELQRLFIISFWGKDYSPLEGPCIQAILAKVGDVKLPIVLSTHRGNRLISGELQQHASEITPEDMELLRQLHLMKSPQKLAARKRLGLFSMKKRPDAEYQVLQPENKII